MPCILSVFSFKSHIIYYIGIKKIAKKAIAITSNHSFWYHPSLLAMAEAKDIEICSESDYRLEIKLERQGLA